MRLFKIIFFLHIAFWACPLLAQNRADSIAVSLSVARNDIDRVRLLNDLASEYQSNDPKKMLQFARQALGLSQKIKHAIGEGNAQLNIGNANILLGNYSVALRSFSDAQSVFERQLEQEAANPDAKNGLARAYGSIGIIFSEQSNYAKALQFHLRAVRIYEETGNDEKTARVYNNIGIVYKSRGESFRALEYFLKCLRLQEKLRDRSTGITATNIGNIYLDQKNFPKAIEYYNSALSHFRSYPDQRGIGELYNNLGRYHHQTGHSEKALECYNKALAAFDSIEEKFGASDTYALIGELYYDSNDYPKALSNMTKSLSLGTLLGIPERIRDSEKKLSEIYQKLNNPAEALKHYKLYTAANDSISNYENIRSGIRAEMNYEFEKKEALRNKEREKKELVYNEQEKRHRMQMIFAAVFTLLVFGVIFLVYSRRNLRRTLTLQKELAEYEQKALHLQMNPHFVFNCLGSISSFIVQNGTDQAIKYLSKFSKLMRLTLEYSKESLIPVDREIESLQNYLELEQLRFNNVFTFSIAKADDIEDDMALPPLLLQPFVENAIIHGLIPRKEQGRIDVDFSLQGQNLICTIIDNGIGFNKSHEIKEKLVSVHKSMALDITRKRLEMMEAFTSKTSKVDIKELADESGAITGTKVILSLPVQYITNDKRKDIL
ncbi:MAG TPA: tetratricopeptide repeat protein [Flavobacterium sp.]|jgi:tetratricopeptide (TPR) repeat protein